MTSDYSLGFSLNARPHKRQHFNHHRVKIKVVVLKLYCIRYKIYQFYMRSFIGYTTRTLWSSYLLEQMLVHPPSYWDVFSFVL